MKIQNSIVLRDEDSVGEVAFSDRITMPTERIFKDSGQMIAPCTLARVGVMLYKAKECGDLFKDKDPNSIVRIATFAEDLFHDESLQTYRSSPITIGHPEDDVNTENAKELVKGNLEGLPMADEKKENLQGEAWVSGEAIVCDDAVVTGNAYVYDHARICDSATVDGNAFVGGGRSNSS